MKIAMCTLMMCLAAGMGLAAAPAVEVNANKISVTRDSHPVLEYKFGSVPFKPYVQTLYTPSGINILRDAPHDHLHHHALMFALGVEGISYWGETPENGKEIHRSFQDNAAGTVVSERLDWVNPKGATVLKEEREISLPDHFTDATVLTWRSTLSLPEGAGPTKLTGDHYYGLGMRFLESMDKGGVFENAAGAEGEIVRGDERLSRATWASYKAEADGKPVTVAMFDDPGNVRHPAWWFTMQTPFAYLSSTLNLYREPLEMKPGEPPLALRYGVAVWDGKQDKATIEQTYQKWLESIKK